MQHDKYAVCVLLQVMRVQNIIYYKVILFYE